MNSTDKTCRAAQAFALRLLRRFSSAGAVIAVVAAAIGLPVIAPDTTNGASPVVAIARADCPPDCGGNPGGGNPSGPPGGGTEFVPPSMPAMPSYEAGRGYPASDQNNGVSIYNSAAPQPSQAAQPSQAPVQNQDGTYNRAANGEQQPNKYQQAPNNQEIDKDWRKLSDQLNQQGQQQEQNNAQNNQDNDKTCESVIDSVRQQFPADLFEATEEELTQAREDQQEAERNNDGKPVARAPAILSEEHLAQMAQYGQALTEAIKASGLQCPTTNASGPGKIQPQSPAPQPGPDESSYGQYQCDYNFLSSYQWTNSADLVQEILKNFNAYFRFTTDGPFPLHEGEDINLDGPFGRKEPLKIVSITDRSISFRSLPGHDEGDNRFITFSFNQVPVNPALAPDYRDWHLSVHGWGGVDPLSGPAIPGNGTFTCGVIWSTFASNLGSRLPAANPNYGLGPAI
ncbi:hypothetical protein [Mycobacterium sp. NPDC050853]|uniref:hypothetical protein n=1 Tax=Mycobacterium sp. NPDC050853 TaxID=3155160 RepID=UPI0033DE815A